jgi:hydrogenase maturation factor
MSRLHRVISSGGSGVVEVEDVDGARHVVSLLALDGPAPLPGEWLTVHSGYAIDRVDPVEAHAVQVEILGRSRVPPRQHEGEQGS